MRACIQSCFSHVRLFVTPWPIAPHVPLSMGIFRQEYCSGLLYPPPGGLPNPGIKSTSLVTPALAGGFFTKITTWEVPVNGYRLNKINFQAFPKRLPKDSVGWEDMPLGWFISSWSSLAEPTGLQGSRPHHPGGCNV